MNAPESELSFLKPARQRSLAVGVVAIVLCLIGAFFNRQQFFHSYLMAYIFWLGIPLGAFGILMTHHLVGGTWGFVIQRLLESAIRTFPVTALLFLPILFGIPDLYLWARPEALAHDEILRQKTLYLNIPFLIFRAVVYFAIWISVSHFLTRWSDDQDRAADGALTQRLQNLSGPGLVLYGLTVTFSAIDWVMSLEPRWYSTIYGMIFMVSHALVALAFVTGFGFVLWKRRPLANVTASWVFQDLGNMLLALVMFWAYLSFSQFLLIWVENLKNETPWYLQRITGGWGVIASVLIVFEFALPFLLLLSRAVKRKAEALCALAFMIVVIHLVEVFWFVAPAFHPGVFSIHWLDLAAPVGIGGLWLSVFLWQLESRALYPFHDPRFVAILDRVSEA
jgi:hypothetical protein